MWERIAREFVKGYENIFPVRLGGFAHFDALSAFIISLPAAARNSSTATLGSAVFDRLNRLGSASIQKTAQPAPRMSSG
jgi:hypothetical protein